MSTSWKIHQYIVFLTTLSLIIFSGGCKKAETVTPEIPKQTPPVFSIDHIFISVGGKDYIQFVTRCTTESVDLTSATITDPGNERFSYEYYSDTSDYQIFCKDESFTFPEDFPRQAGVWKFTFTGQLYKDSTDFISTVNDTIVQ
jgi:hypothetical protein